MIIFCTLLIVHRRSVLEQHRADGLDSIGGVKWSLALCLLAVFLLVYFSLWKGVRSTGMVSSVVQNFSLRQIQISLHTLYTIILFSTRVSGLYIYCSVCSQGSIVEIKNIRSIILCQQKVWYRVVCAVNQFKQSAWTRIIMQ